MLVIARKIGQTLLIGDDIEITVSAVRGDQVRLAINAPRSVSILRKETVEQVELVNVAAVESSMDFPDLGTPTPTRTPLQESFETFEVLPIVQTTRGQVESRSRQ